MKSITVEEFKTRIPSDNREYFDNLDKDGQESYVTMYSLYSNLLTEYFIRNFNFKEYDDALINSPYSFPKVKENNMDIYQYLASDKLSFIYIRNNLYIERLSENEQMFLIETFQQDEPHYDDKMNQFIESTFRKVMLENPTDEEEINMFFGPDNKNFMAPNNAIVVGIRFDDYQKIPGQKDEDWLEENNNRLQDVHTLSIILESKLSRKTGIPTVAIKYNDFSVKKKNTADEDSKVLK